MRRSLTDRVGLVLLIAVAALVVMRLAPRIGTPVAVGTQLPELNAEGWLNLPDGEAFDPAGKLVVVDCWASWCPSCLADLPDLATIAADYRPRGVQFVGVTQETAADLPAIEATISRTPGFDWPVAYGATEFMGRLNIGAIPTVILFGRDGKVRWSGNGSSGLEQAIQDALSEPGVPKA